MIAERGVRTADCGPRRAYRLPSAFTALALTCLAAGNARARDKSLPVFVQPEPAWGGQLVQECVPYQPSALFIPPGEEKTPILLDQLWPRGDVSYVEEVAEPANSQIPSGARSGIFQQIFFTGTWLPQLENDNLGWGDLETGVVLGFPFFRRETPLLITPQFGVHYLQRPAALDLPDRVYGTAFQFRHLRKFGTGPWAMDVAVTLGYYSDFEQRASDAFRVTGYGLAVYESSPAAKWVVGVAYLNRAGTTVLPIGGVIYQPSPDLKWELIVPRPRVAWRLPRGVPGNGDERWFYLSGEFGGGIWSIERPTTLTQDLLTYRDFRVLLGYERKITGGLSRRLEVGYVFGRELEFESATPDVSLDDTLVLRAGVTY